MSSQALVPHVRMHVLPPYSHGIADPLLSKLEVFYGLNYTIVSLVFLSPFAGYTIASAVNNLVHVHFGQRGVACVAPLCHLVSYLVISLHPPYPVLVSLPALVYPIPPPSRNPESLPTRRCPCLQHGKTGVNT